MGDLFEIIITLVSDVFFSKNRPRSMRAILIALGIAVVFAVIIFVIFIFGIVKRILT